jgi:hypothetical protein
MIVLEGLKSVIKGSVLVQKTFLFTDVFRTFIRICKIKILDFFARVYFPENYERKREIERKRF